MVRQTVVRAAEIEPFVFDTRPEKPVSGDQKAVGITEIVIERIAVTKLAVIVVEIAVRSVGCLVLEQLAGVLVFRGWRWRWLHFRTCSAGKKRAADQERCKTEKKSIHKLHD